MGDVSSVPGLGRFHGEGNSNPLQVFLPGESHGQRSLADYSPQGCKRLDLTENDLAHMCCFFMVSNFIPRLQSLWLETYRTLLGPILTPLCQMESTVVETKVLESGSFCSNPGWNICIMYDFGQGIWSVCLSDLIYEMELITQPLLYSVPTPVLLPWKSHGWRSLVGCGPWGRTESDTTEWLHFHFSLPCIGEGNGNPLQYSCLENPRDGGVWWVAVYAVAIYGVAIYGVAQSRTRLKWLSSSSILECLWELNVICVR